MSELDEGRRGTASASSAEPSRPPTVARHGQLERRRVLPSLLAFVGAALAVLLVAGASLAAIVVAQLDADIDTFVLPGQENEEPVSIGAFKGGFNILIVGSDVCEDGSGCNGRGSAELNDFTMLLHVSEDQTNAVGVSFPRDLVVPVPACPKADGSGDYSAMSARPINETLSYGGLPCTALTVQNLTDVDIQFAGLIKFSGVVAMSDAVGGVPVCVSGPIDDKYSGLQLPEAGTYTLSGNDALAFLRSRHGVGDGGDLTRIEQFTFVQYPGTTEGTGVFAGKVQPVTDEAEKLFAKIRADEPFTLAAAGDGEGAVADPNAPVAPAPTVTADPDATVAPPPEVLNLRGQTAADSTCSVAN